MDSSTKAAPERTDAMALMSTARSLMDAADAMYREERRSLGSRALAFAVDSGLKPRMCYSVTAAASFIGVSDDDLYEEIAAGRLAAFRPGGKKRGWMLAVDEIDRWLQEVAS